MKVTLDGVYASNPTIGDKHSPEGKRLVTKASAKNEA